jgi:hypothetical protein
MTARRPGRGAVALNDSPPGSPATSWLVSRVKTLSTRRPDAMPVAAIILAVIVANSLYLCGAFDPNPVNQQSGLVSSLDRGALPGQDAIDPNTGFTAQALGHRAALDWFDGRSPWWNPDEGIGAPLAGEMQSAALFPPVLVLVLAKGQVFFFMMLEVAAGLSTYFLLRRPRPSHSGGSQGRSARLSISRGPAMAAGVAFALNGTFAWFRHAPTNPIAFLPLLLLGVERSFEAADEKRRSGFTLIALALALSLYAGFPEMALLDGVFAGVWIVARVVELRKDRRARFLGKVAAGGVTGLLLSAPLLVPFLDYLPHADLGGHASATANVHLPGAALPMLLLPYVYGPIFGFTSQGPSQTLQVLWSNVGGFLTTSVVALGLIGLLGRRHRPLRIGLALWLVLALGKTYGIPELWRVLNVVPGFSLLAFNRYQPPSVALAVIVLAALGFQDIVTGALSRRRVAVGAGAALVLVFGAALGALPLYHQVIGAPHYRAWALGSAVWGAVIVGAVGTAALMLSKRLRATVITALVVVDVVAMFVVPQFSAPRSAIVDAAPVAFLRAHLGTSRFFTLGPIEPNYGSYYGVASVNVNDNPIPKAWATFVVKHLDPNARPATFTGVNTLVAASPTPAEAFIQNLGSYEEVGVKYVVVPAGFTIPAAPHPSSLRRVYSDRVAEILELPAPRPYFEANVNSCVLRFTERDQVHASCPRPARLVRRELYMPGWKAFADGKALPVAPYQGLFQAVKVPAGSSVVTYRFVPPYLDFALGAFALGWGAMFLAALNGRRSRLGRAPPAPGSCSD